ncbi:MAG: ATP-grasp domain-containing protein [Actinobacteria bacterium]|nr:ATP-grasp domain-containing protein [Actinomycetota bacterium]
MIVVLPSLSFPRAELAKIVGIQHYEERMLCVLGMLADPKVRVVYLTSVDIDPATVDYYLGWLEDPESARDRLILLSLNDGEIEGLTRKLLRDQRALRRVKDLVGGAPGAYVLPFNVTTAEADFATTVGASLYGPSPELVPLGSKSGSRKVAREAGVPLLEGAEDLYSLEGVERALGRLKRRGTEAGVVKLNNGFSGQGNAVVELGSTTSALEPSTMTFAASEESLESFAAKIAAEGAVVEELLRAPRLMSPSVQMRITPERDIEVISTHEQILGGVDLQVYLGCRFPAEQPYRGVIQEHAIRIAEVLAARGVVGYFGIDFVVVLDASGAPVEIYMSEINLRIGGTWHPFVMTKLVTGASYDVVSGRLMAGDKPKVYVATDNLKSKRFKGLRPEEAIDALQASGLGYDRSAGTGALLHLLGALPEHGKVGATCIGDSRDEADELHEAVVGVLEQAASRPHSKGPPRRSRGG